MRFLFAFTFLLSQMVLADVTTGEFGLSSELHHQAHVCDIVRWLTIRVDSDPSKSTASLIFRGGCEGSLKPGQTDGVEYAIVKSIGPCNEIIYTGESFSKRTVEITDNRTNICEIVLPAVIVAKETTASGVTRTWYSVD